MFSLEETREDLQGASLASDRDAGARKILRRASPCFAQAHLPQPRLGSLTGDRELISDVKRFVRTQEGITLAMLPTRPVVCQESVWKEVQALWMLVLEDSGLLAPSAVHTVRCHKANGLFSLFSFVWPTVRT